MARTKTNTQNNRKTRRTPRGNRHLEIKKKKGRKKTNLGQGLIFHDR